MKLFEESMKEKLLSPTIKTVLFVHFTIDTGKRPNVQNHVRLHVKKSERSSMWEKCKYPLNLFKAAVSRLTKTPVTI